MQDSEGDQNPDSEGDDWYDTFDRSQHLLQGIYYLGIPLTILSSHRWKRTDQAHLNLKPENVIEQEAKGAHFDHYSYKPQYDIAGVRLPPYMTNPNKNSNVAAH